MRVHLFQVSTEPDPEMTITKTDRISVYDTMSRRAMLQRLERAVPFVRLFYLSPSLCCKTHVWNRAGHKPEVCDTLQRVAEAMDPRRASEVPTDQLGIKVLGTPVGHDDHARRLLEKVQAKQVLLDAIPKAPDVSVASSPPLSARAKCQFRVCSLTIKISSGVSAILEHA